MNSTLQVVDQEIIGAVFDDGVEGVPALAEHVPGRYFQRPFSPRSATLPSAMPGLLLAPGSPYSGSSGGNGREAYVSLFRS